MKEVKDILDISTENFGEDVSIFDVLYERISNSRTIYFARMKMTIKKD